LFEVAADVIKRAEDLDDYQAITAAIAKTNLDTIVGKVDWSSGPVKNVSKTPLVGGQWQKEGDTFDLKIVSNSAHPSFPLTGDLKLIYIRPRSGDFRAGDLFESIHGSHS
jgi:branched-chain amino acid transport system substrate-binding protein